MNEMSAAAPGDPSEGNDVGSRAVALTSTPMLYDMMRECVNRVRAALLTQVRTAQTSEARQAAWRRHLRLRDELERVDPDDRASIIENHARWRKEFDELGH